MNLTRVCSALLPLAAAVACSDPNGPGTGKAIDSLPRQLSVSEQKLVAGNNAFAFSLMREINKNQRTDNVFVSPLSASMALGMTANGASGTTWEAMRNTLGLGTASREEIAEGYKSLIALLRGLDASTDFRIANSIWYRPELTVTPSFLAESQSFFDAKVQALNFDDPASITAINSWVNDATAKKIPSIIDDFSGDEVMFLINAIYFKSSWQNRFDKKDTQDAPFFAIDGSSSKVPLMSQSSTMRLGLSTNFTAVDLLYGNSAFAMTVILPDQATNVNTLAESLTESGWKTLEASFTERKAQLYLPRFKLEWKRNLSADLKALGMGVAFSDLDADFSRISTKERLLISDVIQKTFVDVNEEGTEAAAVTSVGVQVTSGPPTIRVDRPFIFVIRERFSGTILFMGKIARL